MVDLAIDLRDVAKTFQRRVQALRGIQMQVQPGEIFGLLGPNGAGKSTLVKIMMTVVRPTRAEGTILGRPIGHKQTLARVGYLPEHHRFPPYLTGRQALEFFAAMAKVDRRTRKRRRGRTAGNGRFGEMGQRKSRHIFQGHAAADRTGPGAGQRSRSCRARRADRRPGSGGPARGPRVAQPAARQGQDDLSE